LLLLIVALLLSTEVRANFTFYFFTSLSLMPYAFGHVTIMCAQFLPVSE
jgi:hypothetical protein